MTVAREVTGDPQAGMRSYRSWGLPPVVLVLSLTATFAAWRAIGHLRASFQRAAVGADFRPLPIRVRMRVRASKSVSPISRSRESLAWRNDDSARTRYWG